MDGHADPRSRYFAVFLAFYPMSVATAYAVAKRPLLAPLVASGIGLAAAGLTAKRGGARGEITAMLVVTPLYAAGHALGMWKGLAVLARDRLSR